MTTRLARFSILAVLVLGLLASTSFAATVVTVALTPTITAPGGQVFIHTAITNQKVSNEAVTVTLSVSNPGTCVTGHLPSQAGAFALALRPSETRLADLSLGIPVSTCAGTYAVTVTVKNSAGTTLASHPPNPLLPFHSYIHDNP